MNRLNKEQLEEIRKRAEAATGGKWAAEVNDGLMDHRTYYRVFSDIETEYSEVTFLVHKLEKKEDADFIANARQDIPALLGHIEALEKEAEVLRDHLEKAEARLRIIAKFAEKGSDVYVRKSR
ncbi:hypothetical protein ACSQ7W_11840 [Bacillus halotolerans]|uniref:hypothetical protein n=1 Tax=Bacillus halotolerans TaxID=260554 RepID=UPI00403FB062